MMCFKCGLQQLLDRSRTIKLAGSHISLIMQIQASTPIAGVCPGPKIPAILNTII